MHYISYTERILTLKSEFKMFLKRDRNFWRWKCFHCAEIKMNWRYLHCISQQLNY